MVLGWMFFQKIKVKSFGIKGFVLVSRWVIDLKYLEVIKGFKSFNLQNWLSTRCRKIDHQNMVHLNKAKYFLIQFYAFGAGTKGDFNNDIWIWSSASHFNCSENINTYQNGWKILQKALSKFVALSTDLKNLKKTLHTWANHLVQPDPKRITTPQQQLSK